MTSLLPAPKATSKQVVRLSGRRDFRVRENALVGTVKPVTQVTHRMARWHQEEAVALQCARECITHLMAICSATSLR